MKLFHLYNQDKGEEKSEELAWLFETIQYKVKLEGGAKTAAKLFMFKIYFDFGFKILTDSTGGVQMLQELNTCSLQKVS